MNININTRSRPTVFLKLRQEQVLTSTRRLSTIGAARYFTILAKVKSGHLLIEGRNAFVHRIKPHKLTSATFLYRSIDDHSMSPNADAPALFTMPHKPEGKNDLTKATFSEIFSLPRPRI